eukprot:scaffold76402_cov33-Tisochrysis_lutea.AAC.2
MERSPTPSSLAVMAASTGDVSMDTPLSRKRARADDPPSQVCASQSAHSPPKRAKRTAWEPMPNANAGCQEGATRSCFFCHTPLVYFATTI